MIEPSEEVKEVERRYEETIDKMQQLVDRLKTERRSQAEFEQYAKEHGYIICTTNIIEQIRNEIEKLQGDTVEVADFQGNRYTYESIYKADVLAIIDKHIN